MVVSGIDLIHRINDAVGRLFQLRWYQNQVGIDCHDFTPVILEFTHQPTYRHNVVVRKRIGALVGLGAGVTGRVGVPGALAQWFAIAAGIAGAKGVIKDAGRVFLASSVGAHGQLARPGIDDVVKVIVYQFALDLKALDILRVG